MTRRAGLVVLGLGIAAGAFGIGTTLATAQTSTTTPQAPTTQAPGTATPAAPATPTTPHCNHGGATTSGSSSSL